MKKIIALILVVVIIIGGAYLMRQQTKPVAQVDTKTQQTLVKKTIPSDAVIYDVRTPEEYAAGHAAAAQNLPLQDIQKGIYPSATQETPIYIYCRSGNRSAQATEILQKAGFKTIVDMGGLSDIGNYGLTLVQP